MDATGLIHFGFPRQSQHVRHAGSVNVGIQKTRHRAFKRERGGQIDGCGGFANPTFARSHSKDILDPLQGLQVFLNRVGNNTGGHLHLDLLLPQRLREAVTQRLFNHRPPKPRRITKIDADPNPFCIRFNGPNHLGTDQIAPEYRVDPLPEHIFNFTAGNDGHRISELGGCFRFRAAPYRSNQRAVSRRRSLD